MKHNPSGEKILPLGVPKMGRFCWILCVPMMSHHRNWSREGRKMPKNYQVFYVIPLVSFEGDVQKISTRSDYVKCVKNGDKYTMPVGPFLNLTSLISHLRNKKQSWSKKKLIAIIFFLYRCNRKCLELIPYQFHGILSSRFGDFCTKLSVTIQDGCSPK